jgi:hypothetical protein
VRGVKTAVSYQLSVVRKSNDLSAVGYQLSVAKKPVVSEKAISGTSRRCGLSRAIPVVALVVLLVGGLVGCGSVTFVSGAVPARSVTTVEGFVSVIQPSIIFNQKPSGTDVTLVTFQQQFSGVFSSVTFCGNVSNQFVLGEFTVVDYSFTPGLPCATPIKITVS